MKKPHKDVGASVRARLLQLAKQRGDDFQLLLTRYANERLLYRLTKSQHAGLFLLKGAALTTLWTGHAVGRVPASSRLPGAPVYDLVALSNLFEFDNAAHGYPDGVQR
jgi:hypothetical protein